MEPWRTVALKIALSYLKRNEDSLRDLWDNMKSTNIRIIGVPEGKREKKDLRKYKKR